MKTFNQLTPLGKLRRQGSNSRAALRQYDLDIKRVDLIGKDTNLIYRVTATNGRCYALRLAYPGWRKRENAVSEVMWLDALARETDIPVPSIVRAKNGSGVVDACAKGSDLSQHALLMTWLPGVPLGKRLTEENLSKMGDLFGRMHLHAETWKPPTGFSDDRFDRFMSHGEAPVLFDKSSLKPFSARQRGAIVTMRDIVEAAYAAMNPTDMRVIHCDLWHDNIMLHNGVLTPFDFEDTIWGYRIHDLAMAMLDLIESVGLARYGTLLPIFKEAYERRMPWPQEDLGVFQMGRELWRLNWIAQNKPEALAKEVGFCAGLFERFEETGELCGPPPAE
ncbi:MAG: phosphotransferase [bacterium]|nr:phosphotransferase [bacterium]